MQTILVVSGGRADFGLLIRVCKLIESDPRLFLLVAATGYHLSRDHGYTIEDVRLQNFSELIEVDLEIASDTNDSSSVYLSKAIIKFTELLKKTTIDKVLLLGDRYEIFGASIAAALLNIPIAHIGGGEVTAGSFDEFIRHSITKMASLHFTGHPDYSKRVTQIGEHPNSIHCVGSLGAENIELFRQNLLSKKECENYLGIRLQKKSLFVTLTYPKKINKNLKISDNIKYLNFYEIVNFVAEKNGIHSQKGYLFYSESLSKLFGTSKLNVKDIHNIILNYFNA